MKKYLHYNTAHFCDNQADVGTSRPQGLTPDGFLKEQGSSVALDLSGRMNMTPVSEGITEQESALDLSRHATQEAQEVALDLTKSSTSRTSQHSSSQSYQLSHTVNQSHHSLQPSPGSRHSKSPAGQSYSLLQAALNSNQPNASLHTTFNKICQSTAALIEQRNMIASTAGMPVTDYGRTIKPFSSLSSRPLGITRPHLSHQSGAVIQGLHKPIAITAPQPHNSSAVNTKSQSVSDSTVSVTDASHSVTSTHNQEYAVSQSNYASHQRAQIGRQLHSGKIGIKDSVKNGSEFTQDSNMVERYVIQPPKGLNNFIGNVNVIPADGLAGFPCNQCSKTFKTKAALKLHTTVHKTAEERQYACTICGRRFLHRHHLVVHQRKHSGEKPFKCTACSKSFMAIFLLHKHLRKHARETGLVSEISTEQLRQLHDNKNTPSQKYMPPSLTGKIGPTINENSPVIVLDDDEEDVKKATVEIKVNEDDGKLDRKRYERHKNQNILEMIEKDPKMILEKIKADILKNNADKKQELEEVDEENNEEGVEMRKTSTPHIDDKEAGHVTELNHSAVLTEETIMKETITNESAVTQMNEVDTADHMHEEEVDNTYNYIIKESDESKENFEDSDMKSDYDKPDNVNNEGSIDEVHKPFPEYGSDDEIELDFATGEVKVLGKKILNSEEWKVSENEVDMNENTDNNFENKFVDNEEEVSCFIEEEMRTGDMKTFYKGTEENKVNLKVEDIKMQNKEIPVLKRETLEDGKDTTVEETSVESKEIKGEFDNKRDKRTTESGNIFEKINEMKDLRNVNEQVDIEDKTVAEDTVKVEREVENILGIIKQKLCEGDEEVGSVKKRAKLDECVEDITNKDTFDDTAQFSNNDTNLPSSLKQSRQRKGKKKGKKVKCEICSRSFHSSHYLVLHMAVHKRNPMLQSLKKAKDYQMKALGFLNKTNVSCEVCKKVFKFQKSLNSHMRVHSEKMIQTKLYRKAFRDFMAEAAPQSSKTSEKEKSQIQSSESESQGRRFSAVDKIIDRDIGSVVKQVSCDTDNLNMMLEERYEDPPIKVVVGEDNIKRYLCHACDNTYTTRQKLRMHALIHKDNCFLCDVCGKSFFRHATLEKHISTHMLPRPHICSVCKKSFIHRSSLIRHKVVHDKPALPSVKQQVADLNFEMKMLDTYTMLRHEKMQKVQIQKLLDAAKMEQASLNAVQKCNPLDLTVRIKNEDNNLPPVLSPVSACVPTATQVSPGNLSPPLITHESNGELNEENSSAKETESDQRTGKPEQGKNLDLHESHKKRTESTCSESDMVAVEGHQVVKKRSRKTRVYQTSCRVCKEVFPNVMMLKSHMAVHNTVETHLYECHICRHRFTQSCSLLRHLKTSCQENRMKCVPCGRTFHRRNTFDQHMRLHQGALPNLDGSFYDKRPDEAGIIEESDKENNNMLKTENAFINQDPPIPLREEIVSLIGNDPVNNVTIIKQDGNIKQDDGNDSDSDARTYLYSEGEVHSRYNSDFSDNEWSPPQSPKKPAVAQDLSSTSGNMTLNLLSAVCSDIRNAEKEQELKRKELEEKQKELETIEILANLKRGAIQNSFNATSPASSAHAVSSSPRAEDQIQEKGMNPVIVNTFSYTDNRTYNAMPDYSTNVIKSESPTVGNKETSPKTHQTFADNTRPLYTECKHIPAHSSLSKTHLPSVIEANTASTSEPKIPTVVLEVAAEAERARQKRLENIWQNHPISAPISDPTAVTSFSSAWNPQHTPFAQNLSVKNPHLSAISSTHPPPRGKSPHSSNIPTSGNNIRSKEISLQQEMSQMRVHYPAIQERLSLLMKAQVTTATESLQSAQSHKPNDTMCSSSHTTLARALPPSISTVKSWTSTELDMPQDLSLKTSQVNKTANKRPDSRTKLSIPYSIESSGASPTEGRRIAMSRSLSLEKALPVAPGLMNYENRKSLPTHFSQQLAADVKPELPRSESSRSLPSEIPGSSKSDGKRSESVPMQQPPLVPMHQCALCSRVLYNKTDLQLHMMEHGRSAGELYKLLHSNRDLLEQKSHSPRIPIDFSKAGPSNGFGSPSDEAKSSSPVSLDLSSKKLSDGKMKTLSQPPLVSPVNSPGTPSKFLTSLEHKFGDTSSPISSSDQSDSLPSPSTPSAPSQSAASIDPLRQELRLKIYARRRSQGLDDLKVEFKSPEPAEMSESERLKLMYRRECNRQAAQRSRMRKKDLVDSLLEDLHKEEVVHSDLQRKMEALVAEKNFLVKVYKSHNCVIGPLNLSDNHSLFEAQKLKDGVVTKAKEEVKAKDKVGLISKDKAEVIPREIPGAKAKDKPDVQVINKDDTGSAKVCDLPLNIDSHSKGKFQTPKESHRSKETEKSNNRAKEFPDHFKQISKEESRVPGIGSNIGLMEKDLNVNESDKTVERRSITDGYDDCSDVSDDVDSPIVKLLKDTPDGNKDKNVSESLLIKDNVNDT